MAENPHAPPLDVHLPLAPTVQDGRSPNAAPLLDAEPHAFALRYDIGGVLGVGGMGEVRMCRDKRIGRDVALKILHPGGSRVRFVREACLQGVLEHPSVVPVYDLCIDANGAPCFTMKRVRGMTLEQVIAGLVARDPATIARYSRRKLLTAFSSLCLAVDFAHARGVLHRDLKPSNVMLGDFGEVHVLDWGLARVHEDSADQETSEDARAGAAPAGRATQEGDVIGTPGYMAPEQARGMIHTLDSRADIYALGAILFEILTLEPLHPGETWIERLASTLDGVEPRASVRNPSADVPPELEQIAARAVAPQPEDRCASARELSDAVEQFLDGDRDVERRRALSEVHERAARASIERARLPGEEGRAARAAAMRDLGHALALDPARRSAAGDLARLLMDPPAETPPEVETQIELTIARDRKHGARLAMLSFASWLPLIPLALWMGVRDWTRIGLSLGLLGLSLATSSFLYFSRARVTNARAVVMLTLACTTIASFHGMFGPMMVVPSLIFTCSLLYASLGRMARQRILVTLGGLATFLIPCALEWAGVFPTSYSFEGSRIVIHAQALWFPTVPTLVFLLVGHVGLLSLPVLLMMTVRGENADSERQLLTYAWHLRQMVPSTPDTGRA